METAENNGKSVHCRVGGEREGGQAINTLELLSSALIMEHDVNWMIIKSHFSGRRIMIPFCLFCVLTLPFNELAAS